MSANETTSLSTTVQTTTVSVLNSSMTTTTMNDVDYNRLNTLNYECSDGILIPIISEYTWNPGVRAFLYLLALLWCFLAVAIIADVFMCAIEKITSKTRKVRISDTSSPEGYRDLEVRVWNDTVANLSLLALGTSAPEILLSVIEIIGNDFRAGDLGPGTIVGSASFNLFAISAICIISIPNGETRRIENMKVFGVTSFFCIFAYVWLIICLVASSPGIIDIWEATLTLLFFPLLIVIAYLAEKNFCSTNKFASSNEYKVSGDTGNEEIENARIEGVENGLGAMEMQDRNTFRRSMGSKKSTRDLVKELVLMEDLPEDKVVKIVARKIEEEKPHSRAWHRINAVRQMTASKRKLMPSVPKTHEGLEVSRASQKKENDLSEGGMKSVIEFTAPAVAVLENEGKVRIGIKRLGKSDVPVAVRVWTVAGTACEEEDYVKLDEVVKFEPTEQVKSVFVEIVDDNKWEPDEVFFVQLSVEDDDSVVIGEQSVCEVTIINDDDPGTFTFTKPGLIVKGTSPRIKIPVERVNGADGEVNISWKTFDLTAKSGVDYEGGEGQLEFKHGERKKFIQLSLIRTKNMERDHNFRVELTEADGNAELGKLTKTIVTILDDDEYKGALSRILNKTYGYLDPLKDETYLEQFRNAMNVNGGDIENAETLDYVLHFLTFFWKIVFAFIPPVHILGGWPTFIISLGMIGFLTAIIGDLASLFGCLIGLEDSITAITLVALGTSMPDTFASKTAAIMERNADCSIGNVTGSNSVNVFLGLGLPWFIASLYWYSKGKPFVVPVGSLVFSVILYTTAAVVAILLLVLRRKLKIFGNAELGGPYIPKIVCGVVFGLLWVLYVLFSVLQTKKVINVSF